MYGGLIARYVRGTNCYWITRGTVFIRLGISLRRILITNALNDFQIEGIGLRLYFVPKLFSPIFSNIFGEHIGIVL